MTWYSKNNYKNFKLTFILESCDDQMEPVGVGSPAIGDVFERDKVGPRVDGTYALACMATGQVSLTYYVMYRGKSAGGTNTQKRRKSDW